MPIVDVEVFGEIDAAPDLCGRLAQAIGLALHAAAGAVWVRLVRRPAADYAENGPLPAPLPVFVRVLARSEGAAVLAERARAIAGAVAAVLARPRERVHVIFEPDAAGRVCFGGEPDGR